MCRGGKGAAVRCRRGLRLWCFFFQAEDGIRDDLVIGVQTCALPISCHLPRTGWRRKMRSGFSFSHFKKESRIGFLVIGFLNFRYSDEINEKKRERPQLLHFWIIIFLIYLV